MKNTSTSIRFTLLAALLAVNATDVVLAHDAGALIDQAGNNASATDVAGVTCYDDGNGPADHLAIQIEDASAPVEGLLVNAQIYKNNKMTNITDLVSGDGQGSFLTTLKGGNGLYNISVNKTKAGVRSFKITYHCQTIGDVHTGTDVEVYQYMP